MKRTSALSILFLLFFTCIIIAQDTIIPIWPYEVPNQLITDEKEIRKTERILTISNVQNPTIEVYLPKKSINTRKAVLIFPGGGYHVLAYDWEGTDIAKELNKKGVAGIVVKYRLPTSKSLINSSVAPLQDAQRAIRITRHLAKKWDVDPNQIGAMGFSAGGHLTSTLATHFNKQVYGKETSIDTISARPDFLVLVYPVISFSDIGHSGSKRALLGENPDQKSIDYFSNEKQVTADTPPTILIHAADDEGVHVKNSILFLEALQNHGVAATLHIYAKGGHGFSLAKEDPYLSGWFDRVLEWLGTLD